MHTQSVVGKGSLQIYTWIIQRGCSSSVKVKRYFKSIHWIYMSGFLTMCQVLSPRSLQRRFSFNFEFHHNEALLKVQNPRRNDSMLAEFACTGTLLYSKSHCYLQTQQPVKCMYWSNRARKNAYYTQLRNAQLLLYYSIGPVTNTCSVLSKKPSSQEASD